MHTGTLHSVPKTCDYNMYVMEIKSPYHRRRIISVLLIGGGGGNGWSKFFSNPTSKLCSISA
jgi:hypothetical protein